MMAWLGCCAAAACGGWALRRVAALGSCCGVQQGGGRSCGCLFPMHLYWLQSPTRMPPLLCAPQIFVSDGSKCDIGRLQLMFGADVTVALQVRSRRGLP